MDRMEMEEEVSLLWSNVLIVILLIEDTLSLE